MVIAVHNSTGHKLSPELEKVLLTWKQKRSSLTLLVDRMTAQGDLSKAAHYLKQLNGLSHSLEILLNIEHVPILEPSSTT